MHLHPAPCTLHLHGRADSSGVAQNVNLGHRARLARRPLPPRSNLDRRWRELRAVFRPRHQGRALPVRFALTRRTKAPASRCPNTPTWSGTAFLPDVRPNQLYGYRVHGPYEPSAGHRFNPNKIVMDPYAKSVARTIRWGDEMFGYEVGHPDADLLVRPRATTPRSRRSRPSSIPRSPGATIGRRARRGTTRSSTRCTCAASRCATRTSRRTCAAPTKR